MTAAGGMAMSGGLAVLAERAFSGVRRVTIADPSETEPGVVDAEAPGTVTPTPETLPPPPAAPAATAPVETVAPAVIPVDPAPTAPVPPPLSTTAPPVTVAPIAPPTVAPTAPPTTVAQHHRHRTTLTTGGS